MLEVLIAILVGLSSLALLYFVGLVAGLWRCDEPDCLDIVPPWRAFCRKHSPDREGAPDGQ